MSTKPIVAREKGHGSSLLNASMEVAGPIGLDIPNISTAFSKRANSKFQFSLTRLVPNLRKAAAPGRFPE